MPVKLGERLPAENAEARIEIIPLIDIMFFLLASFMLVSLSMVNLKSVKVNLPTATSGQPDTNKDILDVSVDRSGRIYVDRVAMTDADAVVRLRAAHAANAQLRVFISGDKEARHGDVIRALDVVRGAGIDKVAFEIAQFGAPVAPGAK